MPDERRFSDREFALILRRAAELQESVQEESASGGLTLSEMKGIGAAAGIDPELIAQAAATLPGDEPARGWWRAAASRFHFSETVEGHLPRTALADLIEVARQETDVEGHISQVLETVEWRSASALGKTRLSVTPAEGRTRIRVAVDADTVEGITIAVGSMTGVLATLVVGAMLPVNSLPEIIALAAGGMVATYGALQLTWKMLAGKAEDRGRELLESVVQAARRFSGPQS
jgi:hypothetical protein